MSDFVIDDASVHFAASKTSDYRQRVCERFAAFVGFLQSNELTTRVILEVGEIPNESTKIMKSDLTEEGFQVVRLAYDKWLRGIDSGKPISDMSIMERALAKVRG
jgi:hypothetical protein